MPNHEENHVLIVADDSETIDRLLAESFTEEGIEFARIVPEPEGIERGGCSGEHEPGVICWYEWNIKNWGTKWGAYGEQTVERVEPTRLRVYFQTAWSQPTPILEALEEKYGVAVHAITLDEGGYPAVIYGYPHEYGMTVETVVIHDEEYPDEDYIEERVAFA